MIEILMVTNGFAQGCDALRRIFPSRGHDQEIIAAGRIASPKLGEATHIFLESGIKNEFMTMWKSAQFREARQRRGITKFGTVWRDGYLTGYFATLKEQGRTAFSNRVLGPERHIGQADGESQGQSLEIRAVSRSFLESVLQPLIRGFSNGSLGQYSR